MEARRRTAVLWPVAAVGVATLIGLPFIMLRCTISKTAGPFDRTFCEAVVARVRMLGVGPGETKRFRLDRLDDATSLRLVRPADSAGRGLGAGLVTARRQKDGSLVVVIQTRDFGHAGEYGFAYTEVPQSPFPYGGDWFILDVPDLWLVQPHMRIDDHWWRVVYNLG